MTRRLESLFGALILIAGTAFALSEPAQAASSSRVDPAVATCSFVGFTIAGSTTFRESGPWREIVLENRLDQANAIRIGPHALDLSGRSVATIRVNGRAGSQLEVTARHSGTALYACV